MPKTVGVAVSNATFHFDKLYTYAVLPEHQDKVFERFYRVDGSRSKQTGGTGLGLSIVKHGAEYHHAKVELNSEVGRGTEVTMTFPLATDEEHEA